MIPTIDGQAVLGPWVAATGVPDARRAAFIQATFGQNGLGSTDAGARGRRYPLVGILSGFGPAGLAAAQAAVRSYDDGHAHIYTDSLGTAWPEVMVGPFAAVGRVWQTPAGIFGQKFRVFLTHLT
jgi:hypothetical protein